MAVSRSQWVLISRTPDRASGQGVIRVGGSGLGPPGTSMTVMTPAGGSHAYTASATPPLTTDQLTTIVQDPGVRHLRLTDTRRRPPPGGGPFGPCGHNIAGASAVKAVDHR